MSRSIDLKQTALGIELGSTRIKAVLIDQAHTIIVSGEYSWENQYVDGLWTYDLEEVWIGIQTAYQSLRKDFTKQYNMPLTTFGSIGFSAMMHGYLAFDEAGELLTPFRTWRNTDTRQAAEILTESFQFNIPLRWSIAHLYQAMMDKEAHVRNLDFLTTLAGYVHWKLTGEKAIGVGDASGMFPIDAKTNDYDQQLMDQFNGLREAHDYAWHLTDILPTVFTAGTTAGHLTTAGAKLLDTTATLNAGIPLCPPEGDAGTGMVATNTIRTNTGNLSAGTSVFAMVVLGLPLINYYKEIDIVTTPTGSPVAMIHCNNFTTDMNKWMALFKEFAAKLGMEMDEGELFSLLFNEAMLADETVGGLLHYNYDSGEPIANVTDGRPMFMRLPDSRMNLANFMCSNIYASLATLEIGMEILTEKEETTIDYMLGHGGFFKTKNVGQQMVADCLDIPTSVMTTAGEGGAWGIAILASSLQTELTFTQYLEERVFVSSKMTTIYPDEAGKERFKHYLKQFKTALPIQEKAVKHLN